MTRKEKAAARSTKRDLSRFEHVEREVEAQQSDGGRERKRSGKGVQRGGQRGEGQRGGQREKQRGGQRGGQRGEQRGRGASHRQRGGRTQQESDANTGVYEGTRSKGHISSAPIDISS